MIFQDIIIYCKENFKSSLTSGTLLDKSLANYLIIFFICTLEVQGKDMKQEKLELCRSLYYEPAVYL